MLEVLRCPSCDAEIRFDPGSSLSTCQYCGAQVKMASPAAAPTAVPTAEARLAEAIAIKSSIMNQAIPLIARGTSLPAEHSETLSTSRDNQESITVNLQAGDDPDPERNRDLAAVVIPLKQRSPRGVPMAQLRIEVAADGTVAISGREEGQSHTVRHDAKVSVEG